MKFETVKSSRSSKPFPLLLFGAAFGLNWIWEIGQMFTYRAEAEKSAAEILFFCALGSLVDALTISAIYAATKMFLSPRGWKFYSMAVLLGASCAVIFEKTAFAFGWWSYNERMPIVPVVGAGLLPLVQLTLLAPLAIWIAEYQRETKREK